MTEWDELQLRTFSDTVAAARAGHRRICVYGPTGYGKTRCMIAMIEWALEELGEVSLYTNRRQLCKQTKDILEGHGINVGMRAADHAPALLRPVQLCMTQTEGSRVFAREARDLHESKLVIIDEAHLQKGATMERIIQAAMDRGAVVIGYTASPLDIGDLYDHLLVSAQVSECLAVGALVLAHTYAPDEPDLKHIKKYPVGHDLSEADNAKVMMRPGIFGRVYDHWLRLNPDRLPTILFAPGVKESVWFAEQFYERGQRAAHIDGSDVWLDGMYISGASARDDVIELVRSGEVSVVCNRFVLREGIDIPELRHGILATVFGSLSSYIQSCGRLLRACPWTGKQFATIQDHGGNWWRHGSVNVDRNWSLNMTNHRAVGERQQRLREKKEAEPVTCPVCQRAYIPSSMRRGCPTCGHIARGKSRMVVQISGELRPRQGDIFRPRVVKSKPNTAQRWERYYHSQRRAGRTFNQAYAWFWHEERYWPPRNLPLMPIQLGDWFSKIADIPRDQLIHSTESGAA